MLFKDLPSIRLTQDEIYNWRQCIVILQDHGFTDVEMICYEHDLNNISRWLETDQWKVFQKKCYPYIKIAGIPIGPGIPDDETVYVNI